MAQSSIYRVRFSLQVGGKVVAGPYVTNVIISGGSRGDQHTPSVTSSITTAITNNLASIMSALGAGSGAPGGSVVVDSYDHASTPDGWS